MNHLLSESHKIRMTKVLQNLVDYSEESDELLIEKAKEGDERSFNRLVGLWYNRIYGFCLKYFNDHDRAMESTQKTFIALHRHLGNIRDNGSLKFWLYRVARNQCYEEGRKISRRPWLSLFNNEVQDKQDGYFHPERKINATEKEKWVMALLQQIPEEQREVIIMKEYEEMKFQEIADLLKISVNTAKSRLYYGLNNLRKLIENSGYNYKEHL